ncbi:hypothetical protein [Streptomyces cyaneofuscatus]|uniref:Uncharacterized protein n=1 Tax=Streptomyces cyaneofuscatus TaxID=66883 RepID=A0ABZ1EZR9_9ACTN|nr:hypothetical protein [Streptomyces cyaneofuscatus]WSB09424.1 hypothetical protein OG849_20400 [Streptomyces cyaneofuscatus]WSD47040.1 hypothetical protein OG857_15000 [Streptomyces cyaneofuscatus]WTA90442.1 hypothetical protein OG323_16145 [Streptomyces cyaneofuscatus]
MATQATTKTAAAPHRYSFLQIATALQTLTIFIQAVSAGLLFTTTYGEVLHDVGARVMYGALMLYVLAAVLAWRPGGGSPRQIWYATGFLALASAQVAVGIAHLSSVHVPLGVLMFGLSLLALARQAQSGHRGQGRSTR